jgi:hypothetical protein
MDNDLIFLDNSMTKPFDHQKWQLAKRQTLMMSISYDCMLNPRNEDATV